MTDVIATPERIDRAFRLLDAEIALPGSVLRAYARARIEGRDTREAVLQAFFGREWRTGKAKFEIEAQEAYGEELKVRLEAAEVRIRQKAQSS